MRYIWWILIALTSSTIAIAQTDEVTIDQIFTLEQLKSFGFNKLQPAEQETLRSLIVEALFSIFERGRQQGIKEATDYFTANSPPTDRVIESQIDGDFEGWEGETIVKLMNGQIWQQVDYYYHYHYAFMPDVLIYKSGAQWKMKVEGVDRDVSVVQLR